MFPTGPTEVMVTPLEPPRLGPPGAGSRPRVGSVRSPPFSRPAHANSLLTGHVGCPVSRLPRTVSRSLRYPGTPARGGSTTRSGFDGLVNPSTYEDLVGVRCSPVRKTRPRHGAACPGVPGCGSTPSLAKCLRPQDLEPRSRPDNESVTPPSRPSSFTFCRSRSLSACLASFLPGGPLLSVSLLLRR